MLPLVSVLISVRNAGRYLSASLTSIAEQTYPNVECVLIDDGTTDGSIDACGGVLGQIRRVRLIRHTKSMGVAYSLGEALDAARGEYIARMDGDDRCPRERLERQVRYLLRHRELNVTWTRMRLIDGEDEVIGRTRQHLCLYPEYVRWALRRRNVVAHPAVIAIRSAVVAAGGYRPVFAQAEDYDLWLRMSERGLLALMPEELYEYRVHSGAATSRLPTLVEWWAGVARECARSRARGSSEALLLEEAQTVGRAPEDEVLKHLTRAQIRTVERRLFAVGNAEAANRVRNMTKTQSPDRGRRR